MLSGRWAVPVPDPTAGGGLPLGGLSQAAPLVFDLLPGDVHVQRVTADLTRSGQPPRWISLAPYDLDRPALDALALAATGGVLAASGGWPIVVESGDRGQAERFVSRLAATEPAGPGPSVLVLNYGGPGVRDRPTPSGRVLASPVPGAEALHRLAGGRPALHDSVLDAGRRLGTGELAGIVERSRGVDDLTTRLAARLLQDVPPRTAALLGLVALLGYCHHRFDSLGPVLEACGDLRWWVELDGGWRRFEPAWRDAVVAVCGADPRPQVPLLGRLVGELVDDGAADAAIELCLDAGHPGTASDLLAGFGPNLVALGRPFSVRRWLHRLPRAARHRYRALERQVRAACRAAGRPPQVGPHRPPARLRPSAASLVAGASPSAANPVAGASPSAVSPVTVPRLSEATLVARPGPAAEPVRLAGWPRPSAASPVAGARPASEPVRRPGPLGGSPMALQARLLGPVELSVGGHRVERWRGRRGMLLLAYLLLHRVRPVSRDALAVTFWPDAAPEASRNRLHVAMHALRVDLRVASPVPVVVFDRGYTVNPDLNVRLDTEEFEGAAVRGSRAEQGNDLDAALAGYWDAVREYRGDLLGDHPYDNWTLLPREHYRVRMLEVLDRLAQLAFDTRRYPESVGAGQRLLALDFCREDVHRLLMRAYARLGQAHLAVRQFETCSRQLRQELDMAPAPETIELNDRIRARSPV